MDRRISSGWALLVLCSLPDLLMDRADIHMICEGIEVLCVFSNWELSNIISKMGCPVSKASSPPAYSYAPLPGDGTIRVLTLYGGNLEDPLRGELECVAVDAAGVYEPLSYVWGNDTLTNEIFLPTAQLKLTASIYHALRRLRPRTGSRRVWADQVCIDQRNTEERSQQVQFMNRIYRNGSHVQVWLGLDEQDLAEQAFSFVRHLAGLLANDKEHTAFDMDNLADQSVDYWMPLRHITTLPWFRRGWIVQEIGTRTPATLLWGEAEMAWDALNDVCEKLAEYHHLRVKFKVATSVIKYLHRRFVEPETRSRHDNRFSFIYELHRARHLNFTDPLDRVYAMLGHYSIRHGRNNELKRLVVDYEKSVEEVYTDVAARALTGDNDSLITLAAVQHTRSPSPIEASPRRERRLPSWAPDWRTSQGHIMSEPTSPHRACGSKKPDLRITPSAPEVLTIRGTRIDLIENCSDVLEKGAFHEKKINSGNTTRAAVETLWTEICGNANGFGLHNKYAGGEESSFFAYVQTLSNGCMAIYWQDHAAEEYGAVPHEKWLAHGAAYLAKVVDKAAISPELRGLAEKGDAHKWSRAATGASHNRRFARTTRGYFVMGPQAMEKADIVCVLFGGKMPFCLRPCPGSGFYLLVGECYVHGFMNGEAVDTGMLERREVDERVFEIV
ncbi:heterokaryon incompatibility protein-domain-containing protein [Chaetomium fimeti]|uniref:Heterokaryon incompatibility protein-domain-containing protein n=1 Tax=Chaetomium fimeti TaxID=1854472 RepID=A0AAE0HLZ5_9PEZI|nr:heterokaryon incompatibility protein-domain-containing protein [Chaetomium fimeti]